MIYTNHRDILDTQFRICTGGAQLNNNLILFVQHFFLFTKRNRTNNQKIKIKAFQVP